MDKLLANRKRGVRRRLQVLAEKTLEGSPEKSTFFKHQVEFCGHILREGQRSPARANLCPLNNGNTPVR